MRALPHVLLPLAIACSTPDADPQRTTPPTTSSPTEPEQVTSAYPVGPVAGVAMSVGPRPEYSSPEHEQFSLERNGVSVTSHADVALTVRVEFSGLGATEGLNYVGGGATDCDQLLPDVHEIAVLDDGRWLVDAQLACRSGEDYFEATNEHALLLVDPAAREASVLWTVVDSGSYAMGVCVSSSVTSFELDGTVLRISRTDVTTLDEEAAKELPGAAEGCEPKPEQTQELARIELARAP
jgi:hypothetical protein